MHPGSSLGLKFKNHGVVTHYPQINLLNMSYKILFKLPPILNLYGWTPSLNIRSGSYVKITAEGIYNAETGRLYMVGCNEDTKDCEILINLQLSSLLKSNNGANIISRTIKSRRKNSDPLYFLPLAFEANDPFYHIKNARENQLGQ